MVDKNTILEDILEIEGAEDILGEFNLPCLTCPFAQAEINSLRLGDVAERYSLDLEGMLKELNEL